MGLLGDRLKGGAGMDVEKTRTVVEKPVAEDSIYKRQKLAG